MPSGSQLLSRIATTGMPSVFASAIAIASLLVSTTNIISGTPPISLMPPSARSSFSRSRVRFRISFLVRPPAPSPSSMVSSSRNRLIEFEIVCQLVSVPPNQREFMKNCAHCEAWRDTGSAACRLVPTNSTRPPPATTSRTATSA